jgi:hypothetical protein
MRLSELKGLADLYRPLIEVHTVVREFSQITQIPEVRIRAAMEKYFARYLARMAPYFHRSNGTINWAPLMRRCLFEFFL